MHDKNVGNVFSACVYISAPTCNKSYSLLSALANFALNSSLAGGTNNLGPYDSSRDLACNQFWKNPNPEPPGF